MIVMSTDKGRWNETIGNCIYLLLNFSCVFMYILSILCTNLIMYFTLSYYSQSISPGLVKTNFAFTAMDEEAANECYNTRQSLDPEDITNAIEAVLSTPPHVQVSK